MRTSWIAVFVVVLACVCPGVQAQIGQDPDPLIAPQPCCNPADLPGLADAQFCVSGFACCADGSWRCNDADAVSTCNAAGPVCGETCCDPAAEPGRPGNLPCVGGATCCANGQWQCNDSSGTSICAIDGSVCDLRCCDPALEPGQLDNPLCFEGASCCSNGRWQCNDADGSSSCELDSTPCEGCCDPQDRPGQSNNPPCVEGTTCCSTGEWQCNDGAGGSICEVEGLACDACCDPADEPGQSGNPPCVEGATCCSTGQWQCNDSSGTSSCPIDGVTCRLQCCDPGEEPGAFGNPACFEGATCCGSGKWQCNDATGTSTCRIDGGSCDRCCDPGEQPGAFGNPPCFEGATCCADGGWQCNDAGAESTCDVDGLACEDCCDPADMPSCIEGASCCSSGEWQCNNGAGMSTCPIDGVVCEPRCCDPADRPNDLGNALCATGFTCCDDGRWRCNSADGLSTCPGEPGEECDRTCGGIAGIPCDEGEFCKLGVGECCCDFTGVCVEIPQACPEIYDPVCGCDGVSYTNECEAYAAGVSVEHTGPCEQVCGGIAYMPCDEGEFCRFEEGECCCDQFGTCAPIPDACPAVCDPVCGCDERTYTNECEAAAAGVSVNHRGPCFEGGGLVTDVRFKPQAEMIWRPMPDALGYNVYRKKYTGPPVHDYGECLYTGLKTPGAVIPGTPRPGEVWWLQVTALFPEEGPMGRTGACQPRLPAEPCACTQPSAVDDCEAAIPRWTYDFVTGECEEFVWGGCLPTANNFETLDECQAACADGCIQPPDAGPCEAIVPRWFHSPDTAQCEVFIWGGCEGNANNFETRAECQGECVCNLPPDVGPCDGAIPRWFHNPATGECEQFTWGGCEGNENNFPTEIACQQACVDFCSLPPDVGPCDAVVPRWFHDAESGRCEGFIWGGCGGNANNFETAIGCQQSCVDFCELPADVGPCDSVVPRWFHNTESNACEPFIWGGCEGNANNFATREQCQVACFLTPP